MVGRDLPRDDSLNEALRGLGRRMPKRLMRLPLREGFDRVASTGMICPTSSAVVAGAGAATGTAIGSGAFLGRGLVVALVAVVVLDKGRDGDLVNGREGPATAPSWT